MTGATSEPRMSARIDKSWVVSNSIENQEHDRCVDIFRRPDGTHGFEEFRRDVEDAGKTLLYAGQVGTGFAVGGATEPRKMLTPHIVDEPPISVPVTMARDRWVRPMFETEVE